jgi:hypothetical protein
MTAVVSKGTARLVSLLGMMPPSMTMVEGGRKRVECSWRERSGMGARECHEGVWFGCGEAMAREERMRKKGARRR